MYRHQGRVIVTFIATSTIPVRRRATGESDKHRWRMVPECSILSALDLRERWNMRRQQISIWYVASLVLASVVAGPAVAAPSLGNIDWGSYFDWHSYTDYTNWYSLVLIGSIALLILALLLKGMEAAKSTRESAPIPTAGDRIGTMPIEPPESIALDGDGRGRSRPYRISSPELSTAG